MNQHLRDEETGLAEAERDIATGQLNIRTYGMPVPWLADFIAMLQERHGIQVEVVAGCIVTEDLVRSTKSYNKRMEAEIAQRFGADAPKKISKEAQEVLTRTRKRPSGRLTGLR